jgi:enoyl-CoA hydratase/carnithine racemase
MTKYSNKQFDRSIRSISVLFLANTMQIVTTTIEKSFAIITIKREPVNSMNLEMWQQLQSALDACEDNHKLRGIVITSGLEKSIFTAGNDILELVFLRGILIQVRTQDEQAAVY